MTKRFIIMLTLLFSGMLQAGNDWPEMSIFHLDSNWKNDLGQDMKLKKMAGDVTLVSMVYTSCEHTCPMIVSKLLRVKKALPKAAQKNLKMVLISFDPERDTPKALHAYKQKRGLGDNWTLMSGEKSGIRQLAAVLGVSYKEESKGVFSHSNVLSVIGPNGEVASHIEGLNASTDDMVQKIVQLASNVNSL